MYALVLMVDAGSSQQGIRHLIENNLYGFADGVRPELTTQEPGLSLLAAAAEAYSLLYPGVDFASRIYAPRPVGAALLCFPLHGPYISADAWLWCLCILLPLIKVQASSRCILCILHTIHGSLKCITCHLPARAPNPATH